MVEPTEFEWKAGDDGKRITGTLRIFLRFEAPLVIELARRERGGPSPKCPTLKPNPSPRVSSPGLTGLTGREHGSATPHVKYVSQSLSTDKNSSSSGSEIGHRSAKHKLGSVPLASKLPASNQRTGVFGSSGATVSARQSYNWTAKVLHLPPIALHFTFPPNYPSEEKPVFTLSCKWLNFNQVCSLEAWQ